MLSSIHGIESVHCQLNFDSFDNIRTMYLRTISEKNLQTKIQLSTIINKVRNVSHL